MKIESGTQVMFKNNGLVGLVHKVFDNFNAITSDFILNKDLWLLENVYFKNNKLLNDKWIVIDWDKDEDGGQSIHPISEIKLM